MSLPSQIPREYICPPLQLAPRPGFLQTASGSFYCGSKSSFFVWLSFVGMLLFSIFLMVILTAEDSFVSSIKLILLRQNGPII
ncbi:hypothetical protein VNO77_00719 [Canavalia gladiata]|uniref:Uncharacterized protein n=1 Tax=Canavalia gladiata TaxID=3824 RepID=A0AAN9MPX7_CANGL